MHGRRDGARRRTGAVGGRCGRRAFGAANLGPFETLSREATPRLQLLLGAAAPSPLPQLPDGSVAIRPAASEHRRRRDRLGADALPASSAARYDRRVPLIERGHLRLLHPWQSVPINPLCWYVDPTQVEGVREVRSSEGLIAVHVRMRTGDERHVAGNLEEVLRALGLEPRT